MNRRYLKDTEEAEETHGCATVRGEEFPPSSVALFSNKSVCPREIVPLFRRRAHCGGSSR